MSANNNNITHIIIIIINYRIFVTCCVKLHEIKNTHSRKLQILRFYCIRTINIRRWRESWYHACVLYCSFSILILYNIDSSLFIEFSFCGNVNRFTCSPRKTHQVRQTSNKVKSWLSQTCNTGYSTWQICNKKLFLKFEYSKRT